VSNVTKIRLANFWNKKCRAFLCNFGISEGTAGENEKDKPGFGRGPSHKGEGHRIFEEYDTERLPAEGN